MKDTGCERLKRLLQTEGLQSKGDNRDCHCHGGCAESIQPLLRDLCPERYTLSLLPCVITCWLWLAGMAAGRCRGMQDDTR